MSLHYLNSEVLCHNSMFSHYLCFILLPCFDHIFQPILKLIPWKFNSCSGGAFHPFLDSEDANQHHRGVSFLGSRLAHEWGTSVVRQPPEKYGKTMQNPWFLLILVTICDINGVRPIGCFVSKSADGSCRRPTTYNKSIKSTIFKIIWSEIFV